MQFYIIHPDPATSARLLPDYALKQVNLREGWQILSDIGHMYGVSWEGQNKQYSPSHALTRLFASSQTNFEEFLLNYIANLHEYKRRFGKESSWRGKLESFTRGTADIDLFDRLPADRFEEVRRYLLTAKRDKLSAEEVDGLGNAI